MPWWPPSLGKQTTEIMAGMTPMRTSEKLICTSSRLITMSDAPTKPSPPAKAAPLMAAITGFGLSSIAVSTSA